MSHICIIEDDTAIAEIERDYLEINGFTVSIATDGVSGLNLAQTESFDLILLDLMLPQRLIRISVLDAVAHAVLDMALEDNLSYFMKCRFCRLDLRQDILARHILIHPYGRSPALDR